LQIVTFMVFAIIAACMALIMFIMSLTGIFVGTGYYYYSNYGYRVSYLQCLAAVTYKIAG